MKFRTLNKLYANLLGYFWLPCHICNQPFGGHQAVIGGNKPTSRDGKCICPDCVKAGKGEWPTFTFPDGTTEYYSCSHEQARWESYQAGRTHDVVIDENLPDKVLTRYKSRLADGVDEITAMQYAMAIAYRPTHAHGIEGLIAEIEDMKPLPKADELSERAYRQSLCDAQEIIRKHFGKE